MCVAIAGKVMSLDGDTAKVDVKGNTCDVNVKLVTPKIGDFVLVHAGCAIEVLKEDTAKEIMDIYDELEESMSDNFRNS